MNRKKMAAILSLVLVISGSAISGIAATTPTPVSVALPATSIILVNEFASSSDTLFATGLESDDVVNIYSAATGGTALITGAAATDEIYFEKAITGLSSKGGTVYVSLKSGTKAESSRVAVKYATEPVSKGLSASAITVANNSGTSSDTIVVTGLSSGDVVNLYSAATSGTAMATGTVASTDTSVSISTAQLVAKGGTVYVSVTNANKLESSRATVKYNTEYTTALAATSVKVDNKYGTASDTVVVTGLVSGDVVNMYSATSGGTALASGTVGSGATSVSISTDKLVVAGGTVYVSLTNENKTESTRTAMKYISEPVSTTLSASAITLTNNSGTSSDTVVVTGLVSGDIVNLYSVATSGTALTSGTVASGDTSVSISTDKLVAKGGSVYVTVTNANKLQSARTVIKYNTEVSSAVAATSVTMGNKYGSASDSVVITGLVSGDIYSIYSATSGGTALVTGTVSGTAVFTRTAITGLTATGGTAYVSVTKPNKTESARVAIKYASEPVATSLLTSAVTANNNSGTTSDTIVVTGLASGDIVNVYTVATSGTAISGTVASDATSVSISTDKLITAGGTVYVSLGLTNKLESKRLAVKYTTEITKALVATAVKVDNKYGTGSDTVLVSGLVSGDVVNIYSASSGGTTLVAGTVASGATSVSISTDKLVATGGTVYVSLTNKDKTESTRLAAKYITEPVSTVLASTAVTANNNSGTTSDTVVVTGLVTGDVITIYSVATSGSALASGTAGTEDTSVSISTDKLVAAGGTVYVSIKNATKLESTRLAYKYGTEVSTALVATTITVTNETVGTSDTIAVTGLVEGDTINVYSAASGGTAIGTATVATSGTSATVSVAQLGLTSGSVYVSVIKKDKSESTRVVKAYIAEP
jgi:hypothetical protein